MALLSVLAFTHAVLRDHLRPGDNALDGTAGNGHDTLLLAQCVGEYGKVWAFDVQPAALEHTHQRLLDNHAVAQTSLIATGHQHLADYVDAPLSAAVFNFGWLPGGDKSCTTQPDTSVAALGAALHLLKTGGVLVSVLYPGHEAGRIEAAAIEQWVAALSQKQFAVLRYGFANQKNAPPYLLAIEKLPY